MSTFQNLKLAYIIQRYPIVQKVISMSLFPFFYFFRAICRTNQKQGNIIILSLHKLGDSIFTIPAIKEVIQNYNNNLIVVCFPENKVIYEQVLPNLKYLILKHSDFIFNGRIASKKARRLLGNLKPKHIFDFTTSVRSVSLIFNSNAEEIIGANDIHFKYVYSHFTPIRKKPHIEDIYLDIVKTKFTLSSKSKIKDNNFSKIENKRVLIHPYAGWKAKEWNLTKFIRLAELLSERYEAILIIPLNYLHLDLRNEIRQKGIKIIETATVKDLINEIKKCVIFIGNDSGPAYIANLLGKRIFTIYGSTNPDYHLPRNRLNSYCQQVILCSPNREEKVCFTNGGRHLCPSFECMNQLSVEKVYNEFSQFQLNL